MSNAIDLVVSKDAIKGLDELESKLLKAHESIVKINKLGIKFNGGKPAKELPQAISLQEEYAKVLVATDKAEKQATIAQKGYNKALLEARARKNDANKQTRLQIKYEQALGGVYEKLDAKLSILNNEYRNLAARKELGVKLTIEESKRMDFLTKKITKYDSVLKKVDAQAGKNQRNVGNYKSAFDGLGFSITQLAREAPAFANSMQTGFMAISNNLPMFFDEIGRTVKEVNSLKAEGKATESVMGKLGKSLFSLNVLLSVGVTLLTIYGKDLVNWVMSLNDGSDAVRQITENTKKLNQESANIAGQSIPKFKALVSIINDVTESEERRADAIEVLKKEYPGFNAEILKEKDNTELVNLEVERYIEQIGKKAKAQASMSMLQEKYNKLIIAEQKTQKERDRALSRAQSIDPTIKNHEEAIALLQKRKDEEDKYNVTTMYGTTTQNSRQASLNKLNDALSEEAIIQAEIDQLMGVYIENADLTLDKKKKLKKSDDDELKAIRAKSSSYQSLRLEIEKQISTLEDVNKLYLKGSEESNYLTSQINNLKLALDPLNGAFDDTKNGMNEWSVALKNDEALLLKLRNATDDYLSSFSGDFLNNSELGSFTQFFDGTFDALLIGATTTEEKFAVTFNAIAESAKQAFSFIDQLGGENFDSQYARLEERKNIELQFAGESVAAQEAIEAEYESKRKAIATKQAKAEKDKALFNTAINTAQAIVGFLANPGGVQGIGLSIAAGVMGAAQLAMISSQPIPEFKEGVRGFDGGLAIVGDGGVNEVIETSNGAMMTPSKDTLVNLPKGANVYSNTQEYFNEKLNDILVGNSIKPINSVNVPKGITKEDMDKIMAKHIKNLPNNSPTINYDEKGMRIFMTQGKAKKEILNARVRGIGRKV